MPNPFISRVSPTHTRRPRSRWRRGVSLFLLALIAIGCWQYQRLTDETRLREYAETWLREFSGGEAHVEGVQLDLFHGLSLNGVTLAVPEQARFDEHDNSLAGRTVLRAATVFLQLRPLSLVTGHLAIPEIVAVDPELTLVHRMSDGLGNWSAMFQHRKRIEKTSNGTMHLPKIRLRNVHLIQKRLDNGKRLANRAQIIWADAQPVHDQPSVYDLKLTKVDQSPDGRDITGDSSRLRIDLATLAIAGSLPTMSIDDFLYTAPPDVQRWIELLTLHGNIRPDDLQYDSSAVGRCSLTLTDAHFAVPLDKEEKELDSAKRYLRFNTIGGAIQIEGNRARIELKGKFRDQPIGLMGDLSVETEQGGGLDALGFNLKLTAEGVPLPRDDQNASPSEVRFVQKWPKLRNFVRDFDGIGPVDVAFEISKSPGPGEEIRFVDGTMTPKGVSARFHTFPYRINDLHGLVHFRPDGRIGIKLDGTHDKARIHVEGFDGGFASQEGDLKIRGEDIVLDDALRVCLTEADQLLCRRFNLEARMNIDVAMTRPDAPPGTPNNPWVSVIETEFTGGSLLFDRFPYPLDHLAGRLHIADGIFQISELSAKHDECRIHVSGSAQWSDLEHAALDLQLKATEIPFDGLLAGALPESVRSTYERFDPKGKFDLAGRLFTRSETSDLDYALTANLSNASLRLPGSSVRLAALNGSVELTGDHIATESLRARIGDSDVLLDGKMGMTAADPFHFHLAGEHFTITEAHREALPPEWQAKYDIFKPRGIFKLDLRCSGYSSSQPADGPANGAGFTAVIEPMNAEATYAGFPLALHQIKGKITVDENDVTLEGITAMHAGADIALSGHAHSSGDNTEVELKVRARNLELSDDLRRALPWRIKRQWNDLNPRGRVDVSFDRLAVRLLAADVGDWQFDGQVHMKNAAISVGCELEEMDGTLRATGQMGSDLSIDGQIALKRARVDGRLLNDVTGRITRQLNTSVLRVYDLNSGLYAGRLIGQVDIDYSRIKPNYGVSLTAQEVSLEQFLNASLRPGETPIRIKGNLEAILSLTGEIGNVDTRRGLGHVVIREAQMLKLPLILAILQVIHFAVKDDNAFHDATISYAVDGNELLLNEIDLRGSALSMVGAGRVHTPSQEMDLTLLVGSPLRLPRVEVLSELLEGVARELMEVHVTGPLAKPVFNAEIVRSVKKTLAAIMNARRDER